jgi:acylphosphatase
MPTLQLLIKGKVQGVFYRATAKKVADKFGVTGWIKNTKDGNVKVMVTGTREQLDEFTEWCKQGPDKAAVDNVSVIEEDETVFGDFVVIRG